MTIFYDEITRIAPYFDRLVQSWNSSFSSSSLPPVTTFQPMLIKITVSTTPT